MTAKSVHQILIGASRRDAITNMALDLRRAIADRVESSEIYAVHGGDSTIGNDIRLVKDLPRGREGDVIIYHSSFGVRDLTPVLSSRPEQLVLAYHNITPAKYYDGIDEEFAEGLRWGREELSILRPRVAAAFADSAFNAQELGDLGYGNVTVLPMGVNPGRLIHVPGDGVLENELRGHFPGGFVLFVSQVLPHKRVDIALAMVHLLRSIHHLDVGLVVAGLSHRPSYTRVLEEYRKVLPEAHVLFTGAVTDEQLATLYRTCRVFIGTSDHEGLGVPPLEAMAMGAPVVVRGCGAVPETVGTGALVVPQDADVCEFTGAVARVLSDDALAERLRARGLRRISEFRFMDPVARFMQAIEDLL